MIQIGDYRIHKADKFNWNVEQFLTVQDGKRKGEEYWKVRGYYTDKFCDDCKWLSITEEEQNKVPKGKYKPHWCHKGYRCLTHRGMHPHLPRPVECSWYEGRNNGSV